MNFRTRNKFNMVITPNIIDLSVAHSKGRINCIESNENPYIQESNIKSFKVKQTFNEELSKAKLEPIPLKRSGTVHNIKMIINNKEILIKKNLIRNNIRFSKGKLLKGKVPINLSLNSRSNSKGKDDCKMPSLNDLKLSSSK